MNRRWTPAAALVLVLLLSGCSRDMSDLHQYIEEIKSRKSTAIDPIPQMKPYEPFAYSQGDAPSPFQPFEQVRITSTEPEVVSDGLQPDLTRNREPLEAFPLDGLRMLGTLEVRQERYALIRDPDGIVHRVTYGDHMGQNFGEVVEISDAEIVLEEIVPDGFGGYVKRPAVIAVSDG